MGLGALPSWDGRTSAADPGLGLDGPVRAPAGEKAASGKPGAPSPPRHLGAAPWMVQGRESDPTSLRETELS